MFNVRKKKYNEKETTFHDLKKNVLIDGHNKCNFHINIFHNAIYWQNSVLSLPCWAVVAIKQQQPISITQHFHDFGQKVMNYTYFN